MWLHELFLLFQWMTGHWYLNRKIVWKPQVACIFQPIAAFKPIGTINTINNLWYQNKKKTKKQRKIQNRLATVLVALVHCLPKWPNELSGCCNLKRINPKAIYYMVIALQPISINTNQKTKITFIIRNRTASELYSELPRQHLMSSVDLVCFGLFGWLPQFRWILINNLQRNSHNSIARLLDS